MGSAANREQLGKRARQVLDLLYRRGSLTAAQLLEEAPDLPSYSAARAVLRDLEERGLAFHVREGRQYVYRPEVPVQRARRQAIRRLMDTFFDGSAVRAMQALVDLSGPELDPDEVRELRELIGEAEARQERSNGERDP